MKSHENVVLADNAAVLSSQLLRLDQHFYKCIAYENLANPIAWEDFISYLQLDDKNVTEMFSGFQLKKNSTGDVHLGQRGLDPFVNHLQESLNVLNSICDANHRIGSL